MPLQYKKLGNYIREVDVKNTDLKVSLLLGVSITKKFIPSIANIIGTDLSKYKIVRKGQFAYGPVTSRNGDQVSIALLEDNECIISTSYTVFEISEPEELLNEYLMLLFSNPEFDRYARYNSWGSAREIFSWDELCNTELYIPDIEEQKRIVREYQVIEKRINILEKLNTKLYEITQLNYQKLLSDYTVESDVLPANWNIATVGQYVDVKSGYAFKSDWWKKRGNKVIKIGNIVNNTIDCVNCDCVDKDKSDRAKDYQVKTGDLLIAMTGATTGKVGIVPKINETLWVNQRVGKFYLGDNPFDKLPFLFCTINSRDVHRQTHPNGETGSAQDNLSPDDIKNIKIILPDECKVQEFNNKNKTMFENITNNNGEIIELCKIKEKILSKLL